MLCYTIVFLVEELVGDTIWFELGVSWYEINNCLNVRSDVVDTIWFWMNVLWCGMKHMCEYEKYTDVLIWG